ncbi:MAG: hypothetical protein MZU95_05775 [Desulfomicrobium escambiense]|nr:hypothetical protein [Desulfomicrobium escambiense]
MESVDDAGLMRHLSTVCGQLTIPDLFSSWGSPTGDVRAGASLSPGAVLFSRGFRDLPDAFRVHSASRPCPVPVLFMNGTLDPSCYTGRNRHLATGRDPGRGPVPTEGAWNSWRDWNGIDGEPDLTLLADTDPEGRR